MFVIDLLAGLVACHLINTLYCLSTPSFNCVVLLLHLTFIPLSPAFITPLVYTYCPCPSITFSLFLACCTLLLSSGHFSYPICVYTIHPLHPVTHCGFAVCSPSLLSTTPTADRGKNSITHSVIHCPS